VTARSRPILHWRKVTIFRDAEVARSRHLSVSECKRLLNACDPDFRLIVRAALETGARYGEICRLVVSDFDANRGQLAVRVNETGTPRHIVLTADGVSFFEGVCLGRAGSERSSPKPTASLGLKAPKSGECETPVSEQRSRPLSAITACGIHGRAWQLLPECHCWSLLAIYLGHTDTRMAERHYGHLKEDYVTKTIRETAPRFGKVASNVKAIS
jgi:integrase